MRLSHKLLGLTALFFDLTYVVWLAFNIQHPLGWLVLIADASFAFAIALYLFNHWNQRHQFESSAPPAGTLDIFLPVVNEPIWMIEKTLRAATQINYEPKTLYILDDGNREETRRLARKYRVNYLARLDNTDYKAGNLNHGFRNSSGDFILVLDADQVTTNLNIARDLLGYFAERPEVGIVTTKQIYDVPARNFNHDTGFYEHVQAGKNADNAAISCGSGVIYRRSILEAIGGFQTWNLVEDLYTTYVMHQRGYVSVYVNRGYTIGTAPLDLPMIYKQRGTWALDMLRIFFKRNPFTQPGLTFRQRMHYFEIAYGYMMSALALPVIFLTLPLTLFFDFYLFDPVMYLLLRLPAMFFHLRFYYIQSGRTWTIGQMWAALFPVYFKALLLSLMPNRPRYKVTDKTGGGKGGIGLILPQVMVIVINILAFIWHVFVLKHTLNEGTWTSALWISLMVFWFMPLFRPDSDSEEFPRVIRSVPSESEQPVGTA